MLQSNILLQLSKLASFRMYLALRPKRIRLSKLALLTRKPVKITRKPLLTLINTCTLKVEDSDTSCTKTNTTTGSQKRKWRKRLELLRNFKNSKAAASLTTRRRTSKLTCQTLQLNLMLTTSKRSKRK